MSKEELRHCPKCGATAKVKHDDEYIWVQCKKCGLTSNKIFDYGDDAREMVVEDWNSLEVER